MATRTTPKRLTSPPPRRTTSHPFARLRTGSTLFPAFGSCQVCAGLPSVGRAARRSHRPRCCSRCPRAPTPRPRSSVDALASPSVRYGARTRVNGTLVDGTVALGAQEVVLEGRRYPYEGSYRVIARTTTDADGQVRVQARARPQPPAARRRARPERHIRRSCRPTRCRRSSSPSGRCARRRPALPALHGAQDASAERADALLSRPARGQARVDAPDAASSSARAPAATRRRSTSRCPRAGTARSATRAASAPRRLGNGRPGASCPQLEARVLTARIPHTASFEADRSPLGFVH